MCGLQNFAGSADTYMDVIMVILWVRPISLSLWSSLLVYLPLFLQIWVKNG
jgi:hypothetical protein